MRWAPQIGSIRLRRVSQSKNELISIISRLCLTKTANQNFFTFWEKKIFFPNFSQYERCLSSFYAKSWTCMTSSEVWKMFFRCWRTTVWQFWLADFISGHFLGSSKKLVLKNLRVYFVPDVCLNCSQVHNMAGNEMSSQN